MINIQNAEWLVSLILFSFVYFVSVTINGYIQTWAASKLGDSTAEDAGFLTWNPFVHLDILGFILLIFTHLGWGRFIPFNPLNIQGKYRLPKIFLMHSVETIVSTTIALIALIIAVVMYGTDSITLLGSLMNYETVPLKTAVGLRSLEKCSSFSIIFVLLLLVFAFFNTFIAVLSFILNSFRFALIIGFERGYKYIEYSEYLTIIAPMLFIFLFANPLRQYLLYLILKSACEVSSIFGVI
jgi:hypothetical protein